MTLLNDRLRIPVSEIDHWEGPENAPLTLVQYGDYECPASGFAERVVRQLQETLGDRLRYVFRNFPQPDIHPHAINAAHAAEAAANQSRFWEMHRLLYKNQNNLEKSAIYSLAESLDLDLPCLVRDMNSEEVIDRIQTDIYGGIRSRVRETPTYFINGFLYDGAHSYGEILGELLEMLNMGDAEAG